MPTLGALSILLLLLPGCSVLVGNVRPIEEPFPVTAPRAGLPAPWKSVANASKNQREASNTSSEIPDLHFQNEMTGSTLALSSGCRPSYEQSPPALTAVVQSLPGALTRMEKNTQSPITVHGSSGLLTTLQGSSGKEKIIIHNLVFQKRSCLFDLTMVALEKHFEADRPAFDALLQSLPFPR